MTNLKPSQIIVIGAAIAFGLPTAVGLVVGHFFGFWLGVTIAVLIFAFVMFLAHRQLMKGAQEQKREDRDDND